MCTLSFLRLASGYSLMMNRDESRQRPRVDHIAQASVAGAEGDAVRVAYPVDPPSGGTWVGVNTRGVAFALLNIYPQAYARPAGALSRGRLIPEALRASTAGGGLERVAALDLSLTPPFQLVGVEEGHAPLSLRWDGQRLERRLHGDGAFQLSTTGGDPQRVLPDRAARFGAALAAMQDQGEAEVLAAQEAYHFSQEPEPGPTAVWMSGPVYESVSFTQILVLPRLILLRYWDRQAVEGGQEAELVSLKREN